MGSSDTTPKLASFHLTAVYPFLVEDAVAAGRRTELERFQDVLFSDVEAAPGWEFRSPDDLEAHRLGRWFFREVRTLFLPDLTTGAAPRKPGDACPLLPKFRWLRCSDLSLALLGKPKPANWRLGLAEEAPKKAKNAAPGEVLDQDTEAEQAPKKAKNAVLRVSLYPRGLKFEAFALVSHIGACLLAFRITAEKNLLTLRQAMGLTHFGALAGHSSKCLVLLPHELHGKAASDGTLLLEDDQLEKCWSAVPPGAQVNPSMPPLPSFATVLRDQVLGHFGSPATYPALAGKLPVVTCLQLPGDKGAPPLPPELEWTCARLHRHPDDSAIVAPEGWDRSESLITTVPVTGTQKFLVTSEGAVALGCRKTTFDEQWPNRVAHEYFATYLIALHQSLVAQDISWRSFTRHRRDCDSDIGYDEALFRRFREFDTEYNFVRVSDQSNIQALYSGVREALRVEEAAREVRNELSAWVEGQVREQQTRLNRKQEDLNEEQRNLNSLAVVVTLASAATLFIGLNLTFFDHDSAVRAFSLKGLVWFWAPAAAVVAVARREPARSHLRHVWRYLVTGEPPTPRRPARRDR